MLATLLIVFREVIEAGLIVGIVLAATKGVTGRGLWVSYGVLGGLAGAAVVAAFAGQLGALFEGALARSCSTPPSCLSLSSCSPGTMCGWRATAAPWRRR